VRAARSAVIGFLGAAVLAGCGGDGRNARGDAVDAYIERVNQSSATLVDQNVAINTAFRRFSTSKNSAAEIAALANARDELRRAQRKLAAANPPVEARKLHRFLRRMLALETAVAKDMVWAARYTPRFERTLAPLRTAGARLSHDAAAASGWDAQAAVFREYRTAIAPVLSRLNALDAPPELRPSLVAERTLVRRSVSLAAAAEAALRARRGAEATARISELSRLSTGGIARRAHVRQAAAVKAYNRRLRAIAALRLRADRERLRLVGQVG
jgi:hypothetical protein